MLFAFVNFEGLDSSILIGARDEFGLKDILLAFVDDNNHKRLGNADLYLMTQSELGLCMN